MSRHSTHSNSQFFPASNPEEHLHIILHQPNLSVDAISTEGIPHQPLRLSWFGKLLNALAIVVCEPRHEPTVWQKCDRNGNAYWECYDPICDRTVCFSSEDEARLWIDQCSFIPWYPPY
jgi:hypothetical protein